MNGLEEITKKKGFIYEIGDSFYFIGQDTFTPCYDRRFIDYFEGYKKAIINVEDEENLILYFKKIRTKSNSAISTVEDSQETNKKIIDFINNLDDKQSQELRKQLDDFINTHKKYHKKHNL